MQKDLGFHQLSDQTWAAPQHCSVCKGEGVLYNNHHKRKTAQKPCGRTPAVEMTSLTQQRELGEMSVILAEEPSSPLPIYTLPCLGAC